jgi:hypothetical protein
MVWLEDISHHIRYSLFHQILNAGNNQSHFLETAQSLNIHQIEILSLEKRQEGALGLLWRKLGELPQSPHLQMSNQ